MGAFTSHKRVRSGRLYDPVFLCMVAAMVLAVASSVTLRAVMAGAGQLKNNEDIDAPVDAGDDTPHAAVVPHKLPAPPRVPAEIPAHQNN